MPRTFLRAFGLALLLAFNNIATAQADEKLKVVYHVSEAERVPFVLGNIENHIRGVGGPDKVDIILVAHGPALKAFEKTSAPPTLLERVAGLKKTGVEFDACGNTLNNNKTEVTALADGFVRVDQGGVVRIAELQKQGYIYIRP